jgi:hypothetical protein
MRLKEYRRWKDDILCARTSGADGDTPRQITQDGKIIFHHRCLRCGRDFVQAIDRARWQAATAGIRRIELLADSVTERWVREECPGRLLPADDLFSGHATGQRTQGK